ncbi:tetratricopeptide repeat domain protein [Verrucomicrobiia bacterium DG1235]|nr:tetratricopeptide repeat domain protein [Verrucomicrobiae bacterium DG1235]
MAKNNPRKSSPKNDERNVVGPDQVDIQDIENQVIMIWEKNKGSIIGGIAFVLAVFLGFQGVKLMKVKAEENLKEGYQEASAEGTKAEWAADKTGKALSGFAFKELGDEAYANGNLAEAENYYREAVASTKEPIKEAATIALAITLVDQGKTSDAKALLQPIADNPLALAQAEAQYRLASIATKEGDADTARSLIESINEQAFFWKSRAQTLENGLPKA